MDLKTLFFFVILFAALSNLLHFYYYFKVHQSKKNTRIRYYDYVVENIDTQPLKLLYQSSTNHFRKDSTTGRLSTQEIIIGLVACYGRLEESLNAIKSAIVFSSTPLRFVIFCEERHGATLTTTLEGWKMATGNSFTFNLYGITYPVGENVDDWRNLGKPCASQGLFFPSLLQSVDAILYIDTDVLFLSPVEDVWHHFSVMGSTQQIALAWETYETYETAKESQYRGSGLNTGVMLMNLTRMRDSHWSRLMLKFYYEHQSLLHSGDAHLVNLFAQSYPEALLVLHPRYNFRHEYCNVRSHGYNVSILHGARETFHSNRNLLTAIYKAWLQYTVGSDPYMNLYLAMKYYMKISLNSPCKEVQHIFTKGLEALA